MLLLLLPLQLLQHLLLCLLLLHLAAAAMPNFRHPYLAVEDLQAATIAEQHVAMLLLLLPLQLLQHLLQLLHLPLQLLMLPLQLV